ncbi:uncharacterized protein [Hetaerina americana]|uniref:uncharacterized protein n=1 Tax=Hetaerina americana TaxID=62018 RepID=UPI003A7F48F0
MKRIGLALIRERIHHHRSSLDDNAKQLLDLHLQLATQLSPMDWEYIDRATAAQGEMLLRRNTERQKTKYDRLDVRKDSLHAPEQKRVVVNLSSAEIDEATSLVLSKGLNFVPTSRRIPYLEILGSVEQAVRNLPVEAAEDVRGEISMALKRAVPPKSNISGEERRALNTLRKNSAITVLPADKGNATVLLNAEDYHRKIQELLHDPTYRTIPRDPTDSIVRKTIALIKKSLPTSERNSSLVPQAPAPPRLYGLPKIHKEGTPIRPIRPFETEESDGG